LAAQYSVNPGENPRLYHLLKDTFNEVRQLSHDLYPPGLRENGLGYTLRNLRERFETKFNLEVEIKGNPEILDETRQLLIFRFSQELISNSARHAEATKVTIRLNCEKNFCKLTITDNGKGFNPNSKEGIGLRSIKTRLSDYPDASLEIKKAKDGGTEVSIELPATE